MVNEIFASIQGEGPWVGERHIFVRFQGCDIACRYCDTPASARSPASGTAPVVCRTQVAWTGASGYENRENPLSAETLGGLCSRLVVPGPSLPTLSLTGGEPLLQTQFLVEWLPTIRGQFRIYLETNGIRHEDMHALRDWVDVVSMDFKLPSATGLRPYWQEHEHFLSAVGRAAIVAKAVVTRDTAREEVLTAARIVAGCGRPVPLVLQPAAGTQCPEARLLIEYQNAALGIIPDVRVIPQVHKILNVP